MSGKDPATRGTEIKKSPNGAGRATPREAHLERLLEALLAAERGDFAARLYVSRGEGVMRDIAKASSARRSARLPDQDGFALIRRLRARKPRPGGRIPAIAVTANLGADHRRRALREGFQVCLAKPINPAEFIDLVASLVGGGRE